MPDLTSTTRIQRVGRFDGRTRIIRARRRGESWERVRGWVRLTPANVRRLKHEGFSELELRRWGRRARIPMLWLQRHYR